MPSVTGVVEQVDVKEVKTSFGTSEKLAVKVAGAWYSTFINSKNDYYKRVRSGDSVAIEAVEKGDFKNIVDLRILPPKDNVVALPANPAVASGTKGGSPATSRDLNINYQSARKDGIEFVKLLVANGALPKFSDKAKQADKADILEEAVHAYTLRFAQRALSVESVDLENSIAPYVVSSVPKAEAKQYSE